MEPNQKVHHEASNNSVPSKFKRWVVVLPSAATYLSLYVGFDHFWLYGSFSWWLVLIPVYWILYFLYVKKSGKGKSQDNAGPRDDSVKIEVSEEGLLGTREPTPGAPKALDLLKAGWEFAKHRRDLFVWYVVSLSVMAALTSEALMDMSGITEFTIIIAVFVTMIFLALNTWSIIYTVSQPDLEQVTYEKSFGWAGSNFFPLLWTSILSGLVVVVGLMLFIIPGIIFSVYLYFALYAQAGGVKGGKPALTQSWNDVKGRWWEVAKKLIGIGLYLFLVYLGLAIIYGVFIAVTGESMLGMLIADVAMQGVAGGLIGVVTIHAIGHYYKYLKANPLPEQTVSEPASQ